MKTAISKFIEASIKHREGIDQGDSRTANASYKKLYNSYVWLKENNHVSELVILLDHENEGVRCWAARYTLILNKEKAEKVLEELRSSLSHNVSFSAEMTLKEWEDGNLKF
ncbi:DUF2019 domain-containing protein [Paenibacillus curdlanolyticus]|uniref:DUF2019 domain-containing protein n=1 Tax=Paenibacillus curdlanolyticus TaxID=59840 RepID=UPI00130516D4|nr:DUF2019 domain-containing protein [Paenibacillus curdlanolyticus]